MTHCKAPTACGRADVAVREDEDFGVRQRVAHPRQQVEVLLAAALRFGSGYYQPRFLAVDADQQIERQAVVRGRNEGVADRLVPEHPRAVKRRRRDRRRGQPLEGLGDAPDVRLQVLVHACLPNGAGRIEKGEASA